MADADVRRGFVQDDVLDPLVVLMIPGAVIERIIAIHAASRRVADGAARGAFKSALSRDCNTAHESRDHLRVVQ